MPVWDNLPAFDILERFDGAVTNGRTVGRPSFVQGVEGEAIRLEPGKGATLDATGETLTGYPLTINVWLYIESGSLSSTTVYQWGSTPAFTIDIAGDESANTVGSVGIKVRMSNGRYAMNVRTVALNRDRWYMFSVVVTQFNIFGGAKVTAYVDGLELATGSYNGGLLAITHIDRPETIIVGADGGNVLVDDFAVWKSALTEWQLRSIYEAAPDKDSVVSSKTGWGVVW